jgi:hypothetical protein
MAVHASTWGSGGGSAGMECRADMASSVRSHTAQPGAATGSGPYGSPYEHLADMLTRHDLLLRRELVRNPRGSSDVLGLAVITVDEVESLLDRSDGAADAAARASQLAKIEQMIAALAVHIDGRVQQSLACGQRLPIIELARRFGLSALETDVVITCMAAEVDRRYERIYGYLQDDMGRKLPSLGLALGLACSTRSQQVAARMALNAAAPLRHYRIIEIVEDGGTSPWLAKAMHVDERIVSFLLDDRAMDSRVMPFVTRWDAHAGLTTAASGRQIELEDVIAQAVRRPRSTPVQVKPIVYLHGPGATTADVSVRETAQRLDLPIIVVDAGRLSAPGVDFARSIFLLMREGLLSQVALFLRDIDHVLGQDPDGTRYHALLCGFIEMGSIIFLSGERPWAWKLPPEPATLWPVKLRAAGFVEQFATWRALTDASIPDDALHRLTSLHPMAPSGISAAWRLARSTAQVDGVKRPVSVEHLQWACRAHAHSSGGGLARRIEPAHDWNDLVLPAMQLEQLRTICSQAKHMSTVYGAWGFERKLSLGKGLNALFSGPPGTGKTMAASVIAAELGLELFSIDLSQVVSKYIGETEKNLRQLFDQSAAAHAILLLDEADALLGKRSAVKDAHDRYANTEIAYLLQKMEEYEGITILTTNLRQNMDEAFTRRMRFIVEFPFPEDADRLRIWTSVWPSEVPRDRDVDLERLARHFSLSGGSIRNAALAAAFLAAEEGGIVATRHLVHAARRELLKMGRLVDDVDDPYVSASVARPSSENAARLPS